MKRTVNDNELELWAKETPQACRNFIQLCMEGYKDDTIFHRIIKGFITQHGDSTVTGEGKKYGKPFKDDSRTKLRFCGRGLIAIANAREDDNGSQSFFTLGSTSELQNKHTIFCKVTEETVYSMLEFEEALVNENDRPLYPTKLIKTITFNNPFSDIIPRIIVDFNILSFGEEAEEAEEESVITNKKFSALKLSSQQTVEPSGLANKKRKQDHSSYWENFKGLDVTCLASDSCINGPNYTNAHSYGSVNEHKGLGSYDPNPSEYMRLEQALFTFRLQHSDRALHCPNAAYKSMIFRRT
ncbi:Peptidyl-prolyl cis-trans isomerase CWC27 like protein [Eufriesea mexicana]|uniref:Peptidyl-prolyl cis-trans isomerase n=1 Tax=Eufriesea mexicana TaxID=516756 RepID=A0A310SM38_9HYME|nr:Peptidyl-prolyl cis-trans isomerase CWC27 like protein [Eufriesea mexicana]